jgi:hypothetical protein
MKVINDVKGNPYLTVFDEDKMVMIQIHSYDDIGPGPHYLCIDKRCVPELIVALESVENW